MPNENQDQVDPAVEETKQEETVEISEAEQKGQVRALLGEETKEESEEVQEEPQTETEEIQSQEPVISDEMIEQFPQLKMYRGKPLKDLGKAYANLVGKLHQTIKENNELKGKLEKSSLTELGDPPDPIENREAFDKWLQKRDELIKSQIPKSEPQPTIDPLMEAKKRLPEGTDVQKLADAWAKFNARMLFDETGNLKQEIKSLYEKEPELMIDSIVNFHSLLSKTEQNELAIETKAKQEAYNKTKDAFKKARKTQSESSQVNVVSRTNETTPEDEILSKIYQAAQSG